MERFIFGCVLMLCGTIGDTGWLIAAASVFGPSSWTSLLNLFPIVGFGRLDGYIVLIFYAIALVGASIAVRELKN